MDTNHCSSVLMSISPPISSLANSSTWGDGIRSLAGYPDKGSVGLSSTSNILDRLCHGVVITDADPIIDHIRDLISELSLPEGRFCIYLQERQILEHEKHVAELVQRLRPVGIKFALDGIGLGKDLYSLGYLRDISMNYIKLSAQTIAKAADGALYEASNHALANISRDLEAPLTGIDAESQAHLLRFRELGIAYVQGHALSEPEPLMPCWMGAHASAARHLHCVT